MRALRHRIQPHEHEKGETRRHTSQHATRFSAAKNREETAFTRSRFIRKNVCAVIYVAVATWCITLMIGWQTAPAKPSALYVCGWYHDSPWVPAMFDDFEQRGLLNSSHLPSFTASDVAVIGGRGPCPVTLDWASENFPGKILIVYGETHSRIEPIGNMYGMGIMYEDTERSLYYPWGLLQAIDDKRIFDALVYPDHKKRNTGQHFLAYAASNCVDFRERAYRELSALGRVDHLGPCDGGTGPEANATNRFYRRKPHNYHNAIFSEYRFCLVMENSNVHGYVSEKIVNAFFAGCVPIYYGTDLVYDIFNKKAFVFWDAEKENADAAALSMISYLERNRTAYNEMLNEPILAQGNKTVEKYFSFSKEVGGGLFRKRLRTLLSV